MLCFTTCYRTRARREYKQIMSSTISIPTNTLIFENGDVIERTIDFTCNYNMLVIIDSTECSYCRVSELFPVASYIDSLSRKCNFSFGVLIESPREISNELKRFISYMNPSFPVIFDTELQYRQRNMVPKNPLFHGIFFNDEGTPLFIGIPRPNSKTNDLFINLLKDIELL